MEYLKDPLDRDELSLIIGAIDDSPSAMVRQDSTFTDLGLRETDLVDPTAVVELLLKHPPLMQRPVGVLGDRAVVARPSERILELFDR